MYRHPLLSLILINYLQDSLLGQKIVVKSE